MRPLLLALALAVPAHAAEQKIAYSNGAIYVAGLDGRHPHKLAQGSWPSISPDGAKVACNTEGESTPERRIVIVEIAGRKKTLLTAIPSDNCFGPTWSPDGSQLAFSLFDKGDWQIGLVNADGTHFRLVRNPKPKADALYGATWAADGKSLFCLDLDALYRLDLQGKVLQQWSFSSLFGGRAGVNSGCILAPSPDGKTLLFDADMDADIERPEWDGPPPAIWQLDLATGKAAQVTKTELFAWHPAWINDHEILCNHTPKGAKEIAIYRLDLKTGGAPALVIGNGADATVSR